MSLKFRSIAAAVALAVSASGAQAALTTGASSTDAELFFIAFDPGTNHTFVKDLGVTFSSLAANSTSTSWFTTLDLGSLVTPGNGSGAFNFGTGVLWNIAAGRTKPSGAGTSANNGVFATVDLKNTNAAGLILQPGGTSLSAANGVLNSLRTAVVNKAGQLNNGFAPGTENTVLSQDGNHFVVNTPALEWAFEPGWGENFNSQSAIDSAGEIGATEALAFYHWYLAGTGSASAVISEAQAGLWRLSQTGMLSYSAPAPVPVPGALWLLSSAIASLGVARRRG